MMKGKAENFWFGLFWMGFWVPHSKKFNSSFLEAGSTRTVTKEFIFDCQFKDNLFFANG